MFKPQATPLLNLHSSSFESDNNYNFHLASAFPIPHGAPGVFNSPPFSSSGAAAAFTPINNSASNSQQPSGFYNTKMDDRNDSGNSYHGGEGSRPRGYDEDEIARAEQEALKYEPPVTGPLVGEKKSCHALTEEYAKADRIYVAKTAALPQTYSHYRPIRGDGSCGWRAIACGYFESLLQGDSARIHQEITRITGLNSFLIEAGFEQWAFEDMVDSTIDLMKRMAAVIDSGGVRDESIIIDSLNDPDTSNHIAYHLRLLASATIRLYRAEYEPFTAGLGAEGYAKAWLEPTSTEIEHLGIQLLVDTLLKPASVALEIIYLDRSQGSEVNSHRFGSEGVSGLPTIYLLYRPGHYDVLYKHPQRIQMPEIKVYRASTFAPQQQATGMGTFNMDVLAQIPGMSMMGPPHGFPPIYSQPPIPITQTSYPTSPTSPHPTAYPQTPTTALPIHPAPSLPSPSVNIPIGVNANVCLPNPNASLGQPSINPFRMSSYEYQAQFDESTAPQFQTSTFKNSHYNTAHYNNPNFHPEQWTPEAEDSGGNAGGGRVGRHYSN